MSKSTKEQVDQIFGQSKRFLIALPMNPSTDAICSALVLRDLFSSKEQTCDVVSHNFSAPQKLSFLQTISEINSSLEPQKKYHVEIDTASSPVNDISYQTKDNKLIIQLTPKAKKINLDDIKIQEQSSAYDVIITIGVAELPELGAIYQDHIELFEQTPIVNIDSRPENSHFGHINWVPLEISSVSELVHQEFFNGKKPSKNLATKLLTGIMDATHSFRTKTMNAKTMLSVSELMQAGANHEEIVNKLYRTKTVGNLRLWGFILDRLRQEATNELVWSIIPQSIFKETGTTEQQVFELMNEVLSHSPQAKTIALFVEKPNSSVDVFVKTLPPINAKELIKNWNPSGSERFAQTNLQGGKLTDIEEQVIRLMKERLHELLAV